MMYTVGLLATKAISRIHFFFFNDTATTEIYTLSLHDALPISTKSQPAAGFSLLCVHVHLPWGDRKSTRLNSSHLVISYAVFCLKKKKTWQFTVWRSIWNSLSIGSLHARTHGYACRWAEHRSRE